MDNISIYIYNRLLNVITSSILNIWDFLISQQVMSLFFPWCCKPWSAEKAAALTRGTREEKIGGCLAISGKRWKKLGQKYREAADLLTDIAINIRIFSMGIPGS